MRFVRYNGQVAAVVRRGTELTAENPGSDLDEHLGLWFGREDGNGNPIVLTIPAECVDACETLTPTYQH
ncbi:MAG: hypothetical protein K8S94_09540 [Planctomycetia bacterium]|nr:hypothetical protein [Planctomycetia bacterium]